MVADYTRNQGAGYLEEIAKTINSSRKSRTKNNSPITAAYIQESLFGQPQAAGRSNSSGYVNFNDRLVGARKQRSLSQ